ncbi:phosphonopyruvate decarboxylase [Saccharopolyspora erythraea NRRL 2338]|uniref:Possible sulfopyruvate decarboxylase beta subunit n=2 Tax=Saccharopolyspora erythraea TaxID=1836 RepID=A4FIH8_SACEN|nr:thiamine pyrophosphate-dependent enzyme [Saccharopolyspora erythraea]EQD87904.1 aldehyde dehydrogenase [Saccharopolyspora erythraea D]PFG97529.1 phosphonopyruvate decarboxylase [Saccharopolyspora erythraea NRRL 2338]QRK87703.1 aldehyde dehydrogenase [Saccharopolyspora erythraea]CAM03853.1 possible sulfopyruvate decarboxylase beta subunit [Saccharopolyspora erythraea NRRL 2338]
MTTRLDRRRFVAELIDRVPGDTLVVSGLGSASYDVFAACDRPGNFYLWGAMGAAVPLALGLALAQPRHPVVAITGDGEHLMGIGALGTIGVRQPPNLDVVVLDNGHFGETGMQSSHTSLGTDLVAVARGFGIADAHRISDLAEVGDLGARIRARQATTYAQVLINTDEPPRALPPRDGVANKNAFRAALGFPTF